MSPQLTIVMMLVVTLGAAFYVAWPLLFSRVRPEDYLGLEGSEPALQRLYFQRDNTYAAMKELEFDLAMGNLSQPDYQQLQDRYKRKAVAILKRIDDAKAGRLSERDLEDEDLDAATSAAPERRRPRPETVVDLDIEQEIEAYRRSSRQAGGPDSATAVKCPSCGKAIKDPDAAFCSKCGARMDRGQSQSRKKR